MTEKQVIEYVQQSSEFQREVHLASLNESVLVKSNDPNDKLESMLNQAAGYIQFLRSLNNGGE